MTFWDDSSRPRNGTIHHGLRPGTVTGIKTIMGCLCAVVSLKQRDAVDIQQVRKLFSLGKLFEVEIGTSLQDEK